MKLIIDINEIYFKQLQTELQNSPEYPNLDYCQIIIASGTPYEERPQGEWIDHSATFWECPDCGHLLEKCCPNCQKEVVLPNRTDMKGEKK